MATNESAAIAVDTELLGKISSSLGFTNTGVSSTVTPGNFDMKSSYGVNRIGDEEVRLKNATGPADQREIISYRNREISSVNTYNKIYYPARVQSGQEFGVRLDEILRTSDENGLVIADEPIVLSISFKAPLSSNMTNEVLTEIFNRALAAVWDDETKTYDWMSIMMGSLNPLVN